MIVRSQRWVSDRAMVEPVSPVPGVERWSFGAFDFDLETERRTVPLVRDDGTVAAYTLPEFVSDPADLEAVARIVINARERWENRQGVGG
jgi:hypothetical protein